MMKMRSVGLLVAGMAVSACALDSEPTSEAVSDPIAEVSLDNGTKVSFIEHRPGALVVAQEYRMTVDPVVTAGRSAVEVYRSIAPGQPVPERLVEAQARADQARAGRPASKVAVKSGIGGTESFTSDWFEAKYCYNESGWSFINCHSNPLVTANMTGKHPDVDEFLATLCVNDGTVSLRVWADGDSVGKKQLNAGWCGSIPWESGFLGTNAAIKDTTTIDSDSAAYALAVKWNE